jgi:hypothetical protein
MAAAHGRRPVLNHLRVIALVLAPLVLTACQGKTMQSGGTNEPRIPDDEPCTDPVSCCPDDKKQCFGDPDKGVVCYCNDLWDCSKDPDKCEQPMPRPGAGDWTCTWSATQYTCTRKGSKDDVPPGGTGWVCSWNEGSWTCTKASPPNPTNKPGGLATWECIVDNKNETLHCRKKAQPQTPPTPPPSPPILDGGASPPTWPPWPSQGKDAGSSQGKDMWSWPFPPTPDAGKTGPTPDAGKIGPPPPLPPGVKPGDKCVPGTKMWCDGTEYCGWGQMTCLPNGTWPSLKACKEPADGARPATKCACYHFYYNPECCETPDCIVPQGSNGQICPKSAGKLCDYCNPLKPECSEAGGKCIITTQHETFCGRGCSAQNPCPTAYTCKTIMSKKGFSSQCFPKDGSCYK